MARIYEVAGLSEKIEVHANLTSAWRSILLDAGNAKIWHGRPSMDSFRWLPVNNYGGLLRAMQRENYTRVPIFYEIDGAYRQIFISCHEIKRIRPAHFGGPKIDRN